MNGLVIIGAGVAGLSAAYHLEQQGFTNYQIFEKDSTVGGMCKSFLIDDFTFDYASHILYTVDSYAEKLIKETLLKSRYKSQLRKAFVYYRNVYTEFPFQGHLYGQEPDIIKECLLGLFKVRCEKALTHANFEEWINSTFGSGIANHFMLPYNRKLWAINLQKMSYDWIAERVPVPEVEEALEGALKPPQKSYGPNSYFWYPLKNGIGALAGGFLPAVRNVNLNSEISKISLSNREVEVNGNRIGYDKLISTVPLPEVISLISDDIPFQVKQAARNLKYNIVYVVSLAVGRSNISDYHWIYFPENKYIFHRVSFPMNLSASMAPEGKSSISAELSVPMHKPLKMTHDEIMETVIAGLLESEILNKSDRILFRDIKCLDPAYVIYTPDREGNIELIHKFLNARGIYPCGRFGSWAYLNMDQSILNGRKIAEELLKPFQGKE
jgi:protoporphyrinogen oxidase